MNVHSPMNSRTPCVEFTQLFQHRLLEQPAPATAPIEERRMSRMMVQKAQNLCAQCPVLEQCLYDSIVRFNVAGYAGGATTRQRAEIRTLLGIKVAAEDLDTVAGVTTPRRHIDHNEFVRLRNANPNAPLDTIAKRLGCSLSTVKRHMRLERAAATAVAERPPQPELPTVGAVLAAYSTVVMKQDRRRGY